MLFIGDIEFCLMQYLCTSICETYKIINRPFVIMSFKSVLCVIYLSHLIISVNTLNVNDLIDDIIEHKTKYIMLMTSTADSLSSNVPKYIIPRIVNKVVTILLSKNELSFIFNNKISEKIKDLLISRSQQNVLKIIFIDATTSKNLTQELIDFTYFLMNSTAKTIRSKCVFILIDLRRNSNKIKKFLKWSWGYKFLHITVLEFVRDRKYKSLLELHYSNFTVTLYEYNPFNNTYGIQYFPSKTEVFHDKLSNFYGYPLEAAILEEPPGVYVRHNYHGNNVLNALDGVGIRLTKELMSVLNFSLNIRINSNNEKLQKFNTRKHNIVKELRNESIDFKINFVSVIGSSSFDKYGFEFSVFLYFYPISLITKQYGVYEMEIPFFIIFSTFITLIFLFILVLILKLDMKIWNMYNIIKIIIGKSMSPAPQKITDRFFFLYLLFMCFLFSMKVIEQVLSIYYYKKIYPDLISLKDMIDAGIVPHITKDTKEVILKLNDSILQEIIDNSGSLESHSDIENCISVLVMNNAKNISGCEVEDNFGQKIRKFFERDKEIRLISVVEQPLLPGWAAMVFSPTSPYVEKFNKLLRTMLENGIISRWTEINMQHYFFSRRGLFNFTFNENQDKVASETKMWSSKKIVFSLGICYFVSTSVLLWELFKYHFKFVKVNVRINKISLRNYIQKHVNKKRNT